MGRDGIRVPHWTDPRALELGLREECFRKVHWDDPCVIFVVAGALIQYTENPNSHPLYLVPHPEIHPGGFALFLSSISHESAVTSTTNLWKRSCALSAGIARTLTSASG